jgi:diguanylate cyclase (GGDEF)-like protein
MIDERELGALERARDAARRAHDTATAACAELESRPISDPITTERLLSAQDRVIAARDRLHAAEDRYEAAKDRRRAAAYLESSYRDELTGVLQRQAGQAELHHELDRAHRSHGDLIIAFIDVDGLKKINDEHGHLAGDAVLQAVGEALKHGLRSYDVIMRFGGDEFVCGLPGATIDEVRRRMADLAKKLGHDHPGASISVGLAELRAEDTLRDVVRRADTDLYARRAVAAAKPRVGC